MNEARSSFAVTDRSRGLWLLDGETLAQLQLWRLGDDAVGAHAIQPGATTALISGIDSVRLLDARGEAVWKLSHPRWKHGGFETGCTWFDDEGRAFAVVPSAGYDGCDIVHVDIGNGEVLHRANISTAPAGLHAIHQAGGWVGLSVGEGQDGAYAWWVRLGGRGLEVIDAGWSDEVLFDADVQGRRVLATPHDMGPIKIRVVSRARGRARYPATDRVLVGLLCLLRR